MRLVVAGKDRSADLGRQIADRAEQREKTASIGLLSPLHSALCLKNEVTTHGYLNQFMRLLKMRHGVSTAPFPVPARAGLSGGIMAAFKRILWRLLRYQHDRVTFQQNLINELLINALEMQKKMMEDRTEEVMKRLETVEAAVERPR